MLFVVRTCSQLFSHPHNTGQVVLLGSDRNGVPLEVVAFEDDHGDLTIMHAMRMRPSYRGVYAEGMG